MAKGFSKVAVEVLLASFPFSFMTRGTVSIICNSNDSKPKRGCIGGIVLLKQESSLVFKCMQHGRLG